MLGEFSLVLELVWITKQLAKSSSFVSKLSSLLDAIGLFVNEILKCSELVEIIFNILYDTRCPILDQVVHDVECLGNSPPLLGFGLEPLPKVLHDDLVVLPIFKLID